MEVSSSRKTYTGSLAVGLGLATRNHADDMRVTRCLGPLMCSSRAWKSNLLGAPIGHFVPLSLHTCHIRPSFILSRTYPQPFHLAPVLRMPSQLESSPVSFHLLQSQLFFESDPITWLFLMFSIGLLSLYVTMNLSVFLSQEWFYVIVF